MRPTLSSEPLLPHPVRDRCGGADCSLCCARGACCWRNGSRGGRPQWPRGQALRRGLMSLRRPGPCTTRPRGETLLWVVSLVRGRLCWVVRVGRGCATGKRCGEKLQPDRVAPASAARAPRRHDAIPHRVKRDSGGLRPPECEPQRQSSSFVMSISWSSYESNWTYSPSRGSHDLTMPM